MSTSDIHGAPAPDTTDTMLYAIEKHCNNYFNPRNDPNDPTRNYPAAFLETANHIMQYCLQPHLFVGEDKQMTAWQEVFAKELSIFKRVKLI